jgi:hypothetical protein
MLLNAAYRLDGVQLRFDPTYQTLTYKRVPDSADYNADSTCRFKHLSVLCGKAMSIGTNNRKKIRKNDVKNASINSLRAEVTVSSSALVFIDISHGGETLRKETTWLT